MFHTWTQTLLYHPHLHGIIAGEGLHPDGSRWILAKPSFLFPIRILAKMMGDSVMTTALLDRLLHHAKIFTLDGESYRIKKSGKKV